MVFMDCFVVAYEQILVFVCVEDKKESKQKKNVERRNMQRSASRLVTLLHSLTLIYLRMPLNATDRMH